MPDFPHYGEGNIQKIDEQDHIRRRPAWFFGGTGADALHVLLFEILHLLVESVFVPEADYIKLSLREDSEVELSATGIGLDVKRTTWGVSHLEAIMAMNAPKHSLSKESFFISGGLYGVGVSASNALCATMMVEVSRDGFLWRQSYREGKAITPVEQVRPLTPDEGTGNRFIFTPDFTILEPNEFNHDTIAARCKDIAYNVPDITIDLRDERVQPPREERFHFERGILDQVHHLNVGYAAIHQPVFGEGNHEAHDWRGLERPPFRMPVRIALQFADTSDTTLLGYMNTVPAIGTDRYFAFLRFAIRRVINAEAIKHNVAPLRWNEIAPGLTAVVSILHPHPGFESQQNPVVINPEVYKAVYETVTDVFCAFAVQHPDEMARILEKCQRNRAELSK